MNERAGPAHRPARGVLAAVCIALTVVVGGPVSDAATPDSAAVAAGRAFLDRYVDADGRVVRRDQGGDTVSEGQAYGMLVAVAIGDRDRFAAIWGWTAANLQRPDGLLSWLWRDGAVVDPSPASDADIAAASALALAGERFADRSYLLAARRLGSAVLANETVTVGVGGRTLVAGPWARDLRAVNVSYFMVNAMSRLYWVTGSWDWAQVAASARHQLDELTAAPPHLPPDWALLGADGDATPSGSFDGKGPRYGYDAARVFVQLAVDCRPAGRAIAARAWDFFDGIPAQYVRAEYALDGSPLVGYSHPVALVAAAATAAAAGDAAASDALLDAAGRVDARSPTYYGAAWLALGRLWLDTPRLGGCPPT